MLFWFWRFLVAPPLLLFYRCSCSKLPFPLNFSRETVFFFCKSWHFRHNGNCIKKEEGKCVTQSSAWRKLLMEEFFYLETCLVKCFEKAKWILKLKLQTDVPFITLSFIPTAQNYAKLKSPPNYIFSSMFEFFILSWFVFYAIQKVINF